jgi:hypothetical protein
MTARSTVALERHSTILKDSNCRRLSWRSRAIDNRVRVFCLRVKGLDAWWFSPGSPSKTSSTFESMFGPACFLAASGVEAAASASHICAGLKHSARARTALALRRETRLCCWSGREFVVL